MEIWLRYGKEKASGALWFHLSVNFVSLENPIYGLAKWNVWFHVGKSWLFLNAFFFSPSETIYTVLSDHYLLYAFQKFLLSM